MNTTLIVSRLRKRKEALRELSSERVASMNTAATPPREIEAIEAFHRYDTGTYGICTDCEEKIPTARLRAKPEAIRCVQCQIEYERSPGTT